jgi:hypothetical protein
MTDKDIHTGTDEKKEEKGCGQAQKQASGCPCAHGGGCPPQARPVCLAVILGVVGVLTYRALRRRKGERR